MKQISETVMEYSKKEYSWFIYLLVLFIPIFGMALGVGTTILLQVQHANYSNLIVNLFFFAGCIVAIRFLNYSKRDLGLQVIEKHLRSHILLSLAVFSLYILFYIFVIRISSLRPFAASTIWGLVTFGVVVFAEEIYYRGILYGFLEKRFSNITALIGASIIFGLLHATQGLGGMVSRAFSGWLWGSIRYSTGMIFLLIFPIHFAYNSIWLLFDGNWSNPPPWAPYALPAIEFLLGLAIVIFGNKSSRSEK